MPGKTIKRPDLRLGRKRPKVPAKLRFRDYLSGAAAIPKAPVTFDYSVKAQAALGKMYLNDSIGDCVEAGQGHLVGVFTGNATGTPFIYRQDCAATCIRASVKANEAVKRRG